jgi:hypothetical protein
VVAGESGEAGNPGTLGMTKRRGSLKGREPLPRARAVVGVVGTSISSPFCAKIKKSHTPQDDGFVGWLERQLVGYAENTKRSKKSQALRMTFLWEF